MSATTASGRAGPPASRLSRIPWQTRTHPSQIHTPGPAIRRSTSFGPLAQNEQAAFSGSRSDVMEPSHGVRQRRAHYDRGDTAGTGGDDVGPVGRLGAARP